MELTQGSETSANYNLTPGKYPKEYIQFDKCVFLFLELHQNGTASKVMQSKELNNFSKSCSFQHEMPTTHTKLCSSTHILGALRH